MSLLHTKTELQFLCKKPLFLNANSRLRKSSQLSYNRLFIHSKGDFSPSFTPSQFMSGFQSPGQSFEIPSGVGFAGGRSGNLTQFCYVSFLQSRIISKKSLFLQAQGSSQFLLAVSWDILDTRLMKLLRLASLLFQKPFTSRCLGPWSLEEEPKKSAK